MLTSAKKTAAACALVAKAFTYFNSKRYDIKVCSKTVRSAYKDYIISLSNCDIDYSDYECNWQGYTSCEGVSQTSACEDVITMSITKTNQSCSYTSSVSNPDSSSLFAKMTVQDNAIYHTGNMNLIVSSPCKFTSSEEVTTGCSPSSCNTNMNPYGFTEVKLNNVVATNPNGYISSLTFYNTNASGDLPLQQRVVNISPANFNAWNTCPSCTNTYTSANIVFGNAFYVPAMNELLSNVVKTLLNGDFSLFQVQKDSNHIIITSLIKHKPTSYWAGINPDQCSISWVNQSGSTTNVLYSPRSSDLRAYPNTQVSKMYEVVNTTTPCGTLSSTFNFSPYWDVNEATSTINKLDLVSTSSVNSYTHIPSTTSCSVTDLEVTGFGASSFTYEWRNPSNVVVSTTNKLQTTQTGTFSIKLTSPSGCSKTQTIIV